jgi:hypothetical protein
LPAVPLHDLVARFNSALLRFIRLLAATQPLMLFIDDLQVRM